MTVFSSHSSTSKPIASCAAFLTDRAIYGCVSIRAVPVVAAAVGGFGFEIVIFLVAAVVEIHLTFLSSKSGRSR